MSQANGLPLRESLSRLFIRCFLGHPWNTGYTLGSVRMMAQVCARAHVCICSRAPVAVKARVRVLRCKLLVALLCEAHFDNSIEFFVYRQAELKVCATSENFRLFRSSESSDSFRVNQEVPTESSDSVSSDSSESSSDSPV